jgi:cyclase
MKKANACYLAAMALILFLSTFSAIPVAAEAKAVPVAGNLYLMVGLEGGNVAFLVTKEGVLVVDSGTSPEEGQAIVAAIAGVTDKPIKYLVLTHYHGDHSFGLQAFPENTVIIGQQNTAENIRRLNEPRLTGFREKQMPELVAAQAGKVAALRKKRGKDLKKEEELLKKIETEFARLKELRFIYPAVTYDSKLRIDLGGETIEVIYSGPAHTNGDSLVYFPALKILHTGDLLFNGLYPYIGAEAGADTANWIVTVKEISAWDVEKFLPGHGPLADKEGLLKQAAYLSDLRDAVQKAITAGQTLEQMKKMPLLPAWKDLGRKEGFPQNITAVYNELKK